MFEKIGIEIYNRLKLIDWISRPGSFAYPIVTNDDGVEITYPACKTPDDVDCETADYMNLAPDDGQVSIAFVSSDGNFEPTKRTAKYTEFTTLVDVVVWYDSRKIGYDGDVDKQWQMASEIVNAVRQSTFSADGLQINHIYFNVTRTDIDAIWSRYGLKNDSRGLYMEPYRTFALQFRLMGRIVWGCFNGTITINRDAC